MGTPAHSAMFVRFAVSQVGEGGQPLQFDTTALQGLYGITAEVGRVRCYLPTRERIQNRYGTLHGGCIATLVDTIGTGALLSRSRRSGVSLNINVHYLAPQPGNGVARIEAEVIRLGATIATVEVSVYDDATGRLVAKGTHVKFLSTSEPELPAVDGMVEHMQHERRAARAALPATPPASKL